ncbi:hypothetical protein A1O3_06060, partial [Capronia epimyces CBS 606.96]
CNPSLLQGEFTYQEASQRGTNTLLHLPYPQAQCQFYNHIYKRQLLVERRVAHHLGLPSSSPCHLSHVEDQIYGSFNLCVLLTIANSKRVHSISAPLPCE